MERDPKRGGLSPPRKENNDRRDVAIIMRLASLCSDSFTGNERPGDYVAAAGDQPPPCYITRRRGLTDSGLDTLSRHWGLCL